MPRSLSALALLSATLFIPAAQGALVVSVNYSGDPTYAGEFQSAANTWQTLLAGYQSGFVMNRSAGSSYAIGQTVSTVYINASTGFIDGAGGILGSAGPTEIVLDLLDYVLATDGNMQFEAVDFAAMSATARQAVILHEMAHVLGFGTLWNLNGVYDNGTGEFTGTYAMQAWQTEFGQTGTPDVELGGGGGTANGHWNEVDGGAGLTGITDSLGRDMRDELMTGWLNNPSFISNMTVASFRDIGFTTTAVPEPGSMALFAAGVALCAAARRRRA